jgi:transcriptional regulator GlxA family with amidase domain
MIASLNRLMDLVEEHLEQQPDVDAWARTTGTTEHHLRRMFASLAGMPEIVAVLDRADDFSVATTELWLPVEPG